MKKALRRYITIELEEGKLKEIGVRRYLEGKINYRNLEVLLGKEDAQAVKASKRIMDNGYLAASYGVHLSSLTQFTKP